MTFFFLALQSTHIQFSHYLTQNQCEIHPFRQKFGVLFLRYTVSAVLDNGLHPLALLIQQSKGGKIIIVSHKTKQYRGSAPHCLCIAVKVKDCNICDGIFSLQLYLFIYWSALIAIVTMQKLPLQI